MRKFRSINGVVKLLITVSLFSAPLAMASVNPISSATHTIMPLMAADNLSRQDAFGLPISILDAPSKRTKLQTALVDSCSDSWWGRSGWQELACGFSGQGWWN